MDEEPDISFSQDGNEDEQNSSVNEKIACHRCRQRKVKCDRMSPCSQCVKADTQCSYATGPKPRERRQRAMVSYTYDSKLDAIAKKIDELGERMSQLSHEPTTGRNPKPIDFANQEESYPYSSFGPTPTSSSIGSTPNHGTSTYNPTSESVHEVHHSSSKAQHEGESSLFAHAAFARRFLQGVIDSTTDAEFAQEMKTVVNSLSAAVHSGKQHSDALENLYPRARTIPQGSTTRHLPLPPLDKVFACLRMAKECPQVATLWLGDYIRPSQFSDYFIKIVSPGPATDTDLIIVHCGLYWLFCECAKAVTDEEVKLDYSTQASACEANLETVLANLHFHQPKNIDLVYAMGMASLYCRQKSKPSAAWEFINSASQMAQTLGLQHNTPIGQEGLEEKAQRRNLFWTIYQTEKMLSLRLGRASTFRDQDITLARPSRAESPKSSFLAELAPGWIRIASIQGRIYDDIYSPGALMQPPHIRTSRARALATELKTVMQHAKGIHDQYELDKGQVLGLDFHEIARSSDRVIGLCLLTLIYRGISPDEPSTSAFCQECIDTARDALQEHDHCAAAITKAQGKTVFLETYINWSIAQSPFIPFIVLFCHIIETGQPSDLEYMRGLVETLESTSTTKEQRTCDKQRRLFKALFDVATKYTEVKSQINGGGIPWSVNQQQYAGAFVPTAPNAFTMDTLDSGGIVGGLGAAPITPHMPQHAGGNIAVADDLAGSAVLQNTPFSDVDMDLDLSGSQLWDWFNKNQSIMRMLEDT